MPAMAGRLPCGGGFGFGSSVARRCWSGAATCCCRGGTPVTVRHEEGGYWAHQRILRLGDAREARTWACCHIRIAGVSNGEERNWILISGRPTAAPHSSHDLLSYQYTFRISHDAECLRRTTPAARMTRYRIRPSCAPDPTRLPPGAAAAPTGFLAHASLASLSHSPAAPGEFRS